MLATPLAAALLLFAVPGAPAQQSAPVAGAEITLRDKQGLGIKGYDPVAYFPEGGAKAKKGDKRRTAVYRGTTYRFASDANRQRFLADPSHFAPAYGGYCAYAMAKDDRVKIDPKSYLIEDGSLLLFYDGLLADTRKKWKSEGPDKLRPDADRYWQVYAQEPRRRASSALQLADGLALGGFDPLSYRAGRPAAGGEDLTTRFRGATYRFVDEATRSSFVADPDRFEPAYGGWCAYAMAKDERVKPDPQRFLVEGGADGRLLVFAEGARPLWTESESKALREAADRHWKAFVEEAGRP